MRTISVLALSICAAVALAVPAAFACPAAHASNAPVRLTFDKSLVGAGVWQGTVSGDVDGGLTTKLLTLDVTGSIWHVTFDWIIDAGSSSFTARLSGTLNTKTGGVVMNGNVISGAWLGAQVHEEGQLVNPDPTVLEFVGSIRLMPATA
jgi:hypothetical protein